MKSMRRSDEVSEKVRWVQPGDVRSVRSDGVSEEVILGCVAPLSSLPRGLTWGYPLLLLVTLAVSTLFSLQGTVLCDLLSGPDEGETERTGLHLVPRVRFECD